MTTPGIFDVVRHLDTGPTDDGEIGVTPVDLADAVWLALMIGSEPAGSAAPPAGTAYKPPTSAPSPPEPPGQPTRPFELSLPDEPDAQADRVGLLVHTPELPALPDSLAVERALRLLRRRVTGRGRVVLDEDATATAAAESGLFIPIMHPASERWLQVDVVVDASRSMTIWREAVGEFLGLLDRHGAFRLVRRWQLDGDAAGPTLRTYQGSARRPKESTRGSRELVDAGGRNIILMITDGVGGAWRAGPMEELLATWRRSAPVIIVNVLPMSMWHRTGLQPVPVLIRAERTEAGPARLSIAPRDYSEAMEIDVGRATMVVSLDGDGMSLLAGLVTGRLPGPVPATAAILSKSDEVDDPLVTLTPAAAVAKFRATASPEAFALACRLAVPVLNLPVMRLLQRAIVPGTGTPVLAEVLLSGLVRRLSPAGRPDEDPDNVLYGFTDEVAATLLDHLTRQDALTVRRMLEKVAAVVESHGDSSRRFQAVISAGTELVGAPATAPFAWLSRAAAAKLSRVAILREPAPTRTLVPNLLPSDPVDDPTLDRGIDPQAPLTYVSYARTTKMASADPGEQEFFADLVGFLRAVGVWPVTGYMHLPGTEESDYLRAVATCQVFIPLLTPAYARSPVCAMEWDLFTRRKAFPWTPGEPADGPSILPVVWRPAPALPSSIARVEPFVPENIPDQTAAVRYQAQGLAHLQATDRLSYEPIVYKLALQVARITASQWTETAGNIARTELRRAFPGDQSTA